MTSAEFALLYREVQLASRAGGQSVVAIDLAAGRSVIVHYLDGSPVESRALLERVNALPAKYREMVLGSFVVDGKTVIVTEFISNFRGFPDWLVGAETSIAADDRKHGAGQPTDAGPRGATMHEAKSPDLFSQIFGTEAGGVPAGTLSDAASRVVNEPLPSLTPIDSSPADRQPSFTGVFLDAPARASVSRQRLRSTAAYKVPQRSDSPLPPLPTAHSPTMPSVAMNDGDFANALSRLSNARDATPDRQSAARVDVNAVSAVAGATAGATAAATGGLLAGASRNDEQSRAFVPSVSAAAGLAGGVAAGTLVSSAISRLSQGRGAASTGRPSWTGRAMHEKRTVAFLMAIAFILVVTAALLLIAALHR